MKLTKRLQACADLVRRGSVTADIGCDHGYIPVYLMENAVIPSAVAADINEGPLASCRALVKKCGFEGKIQCVLSDGLSGIALDRIDDILIAGMGGELIAKILSACPTEQLRDKHLILNPVTHPEKARHFLFQSGFRIKTDRIVADGGHHYNIFDAYYDGDVAFDPEIDIWLGNITDFSDKEYFIHLLHYLKSKEKGGADYRAVIRAVEEKIQ